MHKIHRLDIVRSDGVFAVFSQLCLHPTLGCPIAQLHAQFLVDTIRLLGIEIPAFATQQHMHTPVTKPHTGIVRLNWLEAEREVS